MLAEVGITRFDVRNEIEAGRWTRAGRATVAIGPELPRGELARWWLAVWESGSGAVLDGAAALLASGLTGLSQEVIDVTIPHGSRGHPLPDVRLHRRRRVGALAATGVPRTRVDVATVHAALWARSPREAALLICLPVQQRLVPAARILETWRALPPRCRVPLLGTLIADVCDGAHSLGELDLTDQCRSRGLPPPSRQVVRTGRNGRVYLDAHWPEHRLVVEIDGGHHLAGLNPLDDAFRANDLVLAEDRVLRFPVLALRLDPQAVFDQISRALAVAS